MDHGSAIRTVGLGLGVLALIALGCLTFVQHHTVLRLREQNREQADHLKEIDQPRREAEEARGRQTQEAELQQLRQDNRDLLRLRNEVRELREQAKEAQSLRAANASLLQALQAASLSATQQAMIAAVRQEGAVLGIVARSANDPQNSTSPPPRYNGAVVVQLDPNSPVVTSGLAAGDIIVRVDGRPIENLGQLQAEMLTRKPGDVVTLDVMRNDNLLRIAVPTRAWPK